MRCSGTMRKAEGSHSSGKLASDLPAFLHNPGTMAAAPPQLRDHLLDPSGGLIYHLRALRHRRGRWAPFHAVVAGWLAGWQPGRRELLIVGPSAGYALPAGFLARFDAVTALEPDPLARRLLARRRDAAGLRFGRLDSLTGADGLARLAAAHPHAAVLFSNVLGQVDAPDQDWATLLARHLGGHAWASYHDVISTSVPPLRTTACTVEAPETLPATLARFWGGGQLEVADHRTFRLAGGGPCHYAVWPITPGRWHLVEWVDHPLPAAHAERTEPEKFANNSHLR